MELNEEAGDLGPPYHEAGHALVIVRLDLWKPGWRIVLPNHADAKRLKIGGTVLPAGRALDDPDPPRPKGRFLSRGDEELDCALRHCAARDGIMSLAGVAAQFPRDLSWTKARELSCRGDREDALRRFNEHGFDPPMNPWHTLYEAAVEMVDRDWGAIESIAVGLQFRRELNSDEVIARIEAAEPRRNPHRERSPVFETIDPVDLVAQQLECWRRQDWVDADEREQFRAAAMDLEVKS